MVNNVYNMPLVQFFPNNSSNTLLTITFSKSSGTGKHWFAILQIDKKSVEVFDSLGVKEDVVKNKVHYKKLFRYNVTPVQAPSSSSCGAFCIYFIVHRMCNLDMDYLTLVNDIFQKDFLANEKEVAELLSIL